MNPLNHTRRSAMGSALLGTPLALHALMQSTATGEETQAEEPSADRKAVLSAGMTEQEADCWAKIADAAGAFFALPELHPMDKAEVATAVHVIQNKLLGRPTYRKYLETHRAQAKSTESESPQSESP